MPSTQSSLILVVDASHERSLKICRAIRKHGFKTLETQNGIMALQLAAQKKPAILLVSTRIELVSLAQLRRLMDKDINLREIPLVVYEDAAQPTARRSAARRMKAVAYIRYPALPEQILPVLRNLLQGLRLERRNEKLNLKVHDYIRQLRSVNASAQKFVPAASLKLLGRAHWAEIRQGDWKSIKLAILFADIRGFTTLSESMNPEDNFRFINSYLARMGPIIRKKRGFIDQFIGDGIMALFPASARDAVRAAVAMQKELTVYNQHRARCGSPPIRIGIGVHYGDTIIGTIGENERLAVTVISDAVNIASRLESLTKVYDAGILVSGEFVRALGRSKLPLRAIGNVRVKGKTQKVEVFEVKPPATKRKPKGR